MNLHEIFFAFHRPTPIGRVVRGAESWRCIFGHVEAYGYTIDDTWLFFNPEGAGTDIEITHLHDEVIDRIAKIRCTAETVLSMKPDGRKFRIPLHLPMNCATQCAALVGRRAFSPAGLRKTLLREGATIIYENAQGKPKRQGSPAAGTPHV